LILLSQRMFQKSPYRQSSFAVFRCQILSAILLPGSVPLLFFLFSLPLLHSEGTQMQKSFLLYGCHVRGLFSYNYSKIVYEIFFINFFKTKLNTLYYLLSIDC